MKLLPRLSAVFDKLLNLGAVIGAVLLVAMMLCISYEVVMRYLFNSPTTWVVDMSGLALYGFIFLATGWVLKQEGHTKIDLLLMIFSPRASRITQGAISYLGAIVCGFIFLQTLVDAVETYQQKELLWLTFILPAHTLLWLMPIGFLLLSVQFVRRGWYFFREGYKPVKP